MKNATCMNCSDRTSTCHSTCEKYLNYKHELTHARETKRKYYQSLSKRPIYFKGE